MTHSMIFVMGIRQYEKLGYSDEHRFHSKIHGHIV